MLVSSKSGVVLVELPELCQCYFSTEFFTEALLFRFFCLPCYLLELLGFGIHCSFKRWVGFGRVLCFCQFFTAARFFFFFFFSVQVISVSLSHNGGCFLLFREPFVLCVGSRLRSFDTMSEPTFHT